MLRTSMDHNDGFPSVSRPVPFHRSRSLCAALSSHRIEAVVDVRVLRTDTAAQGRVEPGRSGVDIRRRAGGRGEGGYTRGSQTKVRQPEEKSRHGGTWGGGEGKEGQSIFRQAAKKVEHKFSANVALPRRSKAKHKPPSLLLQPFPAKPFGRDA